MSKSSNARRVDELPESGVVTVACNVPNGVVLKLYNFDESEEPVLGGGTRTRKVAVETGDRIVINGPSFNRSGAQRGAKVAGYIMNHNVDAQFMNKWMADNAQTALVKNGCILVYSNANDASAAAKDRKDFVSGLEPLIPGTDDKGRPNDKRIPRPFKTGIGEIGAIQTSDIP